MAITKNTEVNLIIQKALKELPLNGKGHELVLKLLEMAYSAGKVDAARELREGKEKN